MALESGATLNGSFGYDWMTNHFSNFNIGTELNGFIYHFIAPRPNANNNAYQLQLVTASNVDLGSLPMLSLAMDSPMIGSNITAVVSNTSSVGICMDSICSNAAVEDGYNIETGGTVTTIINSAPIVDAGVDQVPTNEFSTVLTGDANDDGHPNPITAQWTQLDGQGMASFSHATNFQTAVNFPVAGLYQLQLAVDDGALISFDTMAVHVVEASDIGVNYEVIDVGTLYENEPVRVNNIKFQNTGLADLLVFNVGLTGPDAMSFDLGGDCVTVIAPGSICTIAVIFAPQSQISLGEKFAQLIINSDAHSASELSLDIYANLIAAVDTDGDTVADNLDNCTLVVNADQRDTDNDGYGSACDPDLNNNGIVNFLDVGIFSQAFGTNDNPAADCNGDGIANFLDYAIVPGYFLSPPGPGLGGN